MAVKDQIQLVGPGKKATVVTESDAKAAAIPTPNPNANVLRVPEQLPILLAGPIVRRVDATSATIWMATSIEVTMRCTITEIDSGVVVGVAEAASFKLGEHLFINLATVRPATTMPRNKLLGYNFDIILAKPVPGVLGFEGDVLLNPPEVTYGDLPVPTFYLAAEGSSVQVGHVSCRKFHGEGRDAMEQVDNLLRQSVRDMQRRPSALHLTGDQIYADDVNRGIIDGLAMLGRTLLGWDERLPPDNKRVVDFTAGTRSMVRQHGFSVDADVSGNHLLGFGDYAAMYVLAWSPEIWVWERLRKIPAFWWNSENFGSKAIRRVLANMSCYMIFDDHEITDDWNLNPKWMRDTANPLARRVIANGLAAFWAFQSIGNDPLSNRDAALRSAVPAYLAGKGADPGPFESAVLNFHDWNFTAPTARPTVFMDTRTQRGFAPITGDPDKHAVFNKPPSLLNDAGFAKLADAIRNAGSPEDPVLIVSPAPFIGYEKVESAQRVSANIGLVNQPIDPGADPEAWSFNSEGYARFLKVLAQSGHRHFVILSGDVHYGYTAIATCTHRSGGTQRTITLVQATASALRNQPAGKSFHALNLLLGTDDNRYVMFGRQSGNDYLLQSSEFLEEHNLPIPQDWDLQISWRYMRMGSRSVVALNNAGVVLADNDRVTHTVHTVEGQRRATIRWKDIRDHVPTPVTSLSKAATAG